MSSTSTLLFDFPYDLSIFRRSKFTNRARSWVMVSPNTPDPFVKLPHEKILYASPARTSLELLSINPAKQWKVKSDGGVAYITNQRVVFLPSKATEELSSFTSPILSLQDTYVRAPFFGANFWVAIVKPVPGGGIPADHPAVELKMTFREGGAFDFHTCFEGIKERLHMARERERESGRGIGMGLGVDINTDQLPAYEAATDIGEDDGRPPTFSGSQEAEISSVQGPNSGHSPDENHPPTPDEPPPGYEEAQAQAVEVTFEQRERRRAEMGVDGDDETESDVMSRRNVPSRSPESNRDGGAPPPLTGPEAEALRHNPW